MGFTVISQACRHYGRQPEVRLRLFTRPLRHRTPFNNVFEKLVFGPYADGLTDTVVNFPIRVVTVADEPAVHVDLLPPSGLWAMCTRSHVSTDAWFYE